MAELAAIIRELIDRPRMLAVVITLTVLAIGLGAFSLKFGETFGEHAARAAAERAFSASIDILEH